MTDFALLNFNKGTLLYLFFHNKKYYTITKYSYYINKIEVFEIDDEFLKILKNELLVVFKSNQPNIRSCLISNFTVAYMNPQYSSTQASLHLHSPGEDPAKARGFMWTHFGGKLHWSFMVKIIFLMYI